MSDQFHQSLTTIVKILKSSPGSITIQNIQRLANIYKFETFIESINDRVKRLSIAGKILVIDLDYEEIQSKSTTPKDQTFLILKDAKLVLANNNNNFNYHNTTTGNILKNSLTNYKRLGAFDKNLEKLFIFDQFSTDNFDLYNYYIKIYESLVSVFGQDKVELNYDDQFVIKVNNGFLVTLVNDERTNLVRSDFNVSQQQWVTDSTLVNSEVGINVSFIKGPHSITKGFLSQNQIVYEADEGSPEIVLFSANDVYKSKNHSNVKLQGFQFLESEIISINQFTSGNLNSVVDTIKKLEVFSAVIDFINALKEKFITKQEEKVVDVEEEEDLFQEFLNHTQNNTGDAMEVETSFVNVTLTDEYLELQSTLAEFNGKYELKDTPKFPSLTT